MGFAELDELAKHEIILDLAGSTENIATGVAPGVERVGESRRVEVLGEPVLRAAFAAGVFNGLARSKAGTDAAGLGPASVRGGVAEGGKRAAGL